MSDGVGAVSDGVRAVSDGVGPLPGEDRGPTARGREHAQVGYSTIRAVTIPNMPSSLSAWVRMWQCSTHTPGSVACTSTE